ncbi:hypothetical protein Gpo141_00011944 [Globisporangium polare]
MDTQTAPSTLLFHELQALLLQQHRVSGNDVQAASAFGSSPVHRQWLESPLVVQELEKWWTAAPSVLHDSQQQAKAEPSSTLKEQYERFYHLLARGVMTLASAEAFAYKELPRVMVTDFQSDTRKPSTVSNELRFKRSIAVLALTAVAESPQSAGVLASYLHELYEVTFTTGSPSATAKLSPQRKTKQRSLSNNERSLARSATSGVRKSSMLGKVDEVVKLLSETNAYNSSGSRVTRSASAVLPLSNSLAALESLSKRKKSTLVMQHTDSRLRVSQSIREPLDETQGNSESQTTSDNTVLRAIERQSSARKMRQSSKTKIMAGTDPSSSLSKRLFDARLARARSNLSRMGSDLSLRAGRGGLEHHLSSLSLYDGTTSSSSDNSSHFFSIETRLELKERLVELQKQLGDLLVRTKLAWMKCFAEDSLPDSSSQQHVVSREALMAASDLVTKGEHLTAKLHSAFTKAMSTANCPIKEYEDLVESVEIDFRDFQELVRSVAQQSFPSAPPAIAPHASSPQHSEARSSASEPATKSPPAHSVSYDLPSMKSYCAKVAPPYSSYLTSKKWSAAVGSDPFKQ